MVGATYSDPECGPTCVEITVPDDHTCSKGELGVCEAGCSCSEGKDHAA